MKRYQTKPCDACPWRTDIPLGQFGPERFIALAETAYDQAMVQFACHKSPEGAEFGCAGFVLNGATHNLGARFAQSSGRLDRQSAISPYPLFPNYREMAIANGRPARPPGAPSMSRRLTTTVSKTL